jgi:hypothetical protein
MRRAKTSQIPHFDTEDEERDFWATHDSTEFFGQTEEVSEPIVYRGPPRRGSRPSVEVKLEPASLRRLSRLAKTRRVRVEDLLQRWVADRLANES